MTLLMLIDIFTRYTQIDEQSIIDLRMFSYPTSNNGVLYNTNHQTKSGNKTLFYCNLGHRILFFLNTIAITKTIVVEIIIL